MALFEGKTPAERNKMIAALALPLVALIFVARMFFSSGPAKTAGPRPTPSPPHSGQGKVRPQPQPEAEGDTIFGALRPIPEIQNASYGGDPGRNIFAFFVRPTPKPVLPGEVQTPTPTPTPPPPLVLASLSPQSVFARTGNFTLQVSGDKFTPAARVFVDGQPQQTQYRSAQQLTATVPSTAITAPGPRRIEVRTPDGQLFSNTQTLNVMQPPAPTYTYVGLIKRNRYNTAVLRDQKGELYSVRQNDLVEGRFRVTEINERSVEVVDKDLNVKHTMTFVESRSTGVTGRAPGSIQPPPPPPPGDDGDEEP